MSEYEGKYAGGQQAGAGRSDDTAGSDPPAPKCPECGEVGHREADVAWPCPNPWHYKKGQRRQAIDAVPVLKPPKVSEGSGGSRVSKGDLAESYVLVIVQFLREVIKRKHWNGLSQGYVVTEHDLKKVAREYGIAWYRDILRGSE